MARNTKKACCEGCTPKASSEPWERAIHEKTIDSESKPIWRCRNCGTETKRRVKVAGVVARTGGMLRLDANGEIVW